MANDDRTRKRICGRGISLFFIYSHGGRKLLVMQKVGQRMYYFTAPVTYHSSQMSTMEAERGNLINQ